MSLENEAGGAIHKVGHNKTLIIGVCLVVFVVFFAIKARGKTSSSVPVTSGGGNFAIGPGSAQSGGDTSGGYSTNAGSALTTERQNADAIKLLGDTLDLQYNQSSRLQGLSISGANSVETTRETGVTFNESTRETGNSYDTANVLKSGLNTVAVNAAQDAQTLTTAKNQFDFLYGNVNTPTSGGFLRSGAIRRDDSTQVGAASNGVTSGNTPYGSGLNGSPVANRADVLYKYAQQPIQADFVRTQQAADATNNRQIAVNNNNAQNSIITNTANTTNTIAVNKANFNNQYGLNQQQNNAADHAVNVKQRDGITNGIFGTVTKALGSIFHF